MDKYTVETQRVAVAAKVEVADEAWRVAVKATTEIAELKETNHEDIATIQVEVNRKGGVV